MMAIRMKISFKLGDIEKFSMIPKNAREKALTLVGDEYMLDVRENVEAGKTPDGKAFRPYKQEYADLKRRAGRETSPPDLNLTGAMWRAMVAKLSRNGQTLTVSFPGNHPKTRFRSAKGPESGKMRSAPGQSLTVSRTKGSIQTDIIAEANDRIRPFIGVSQTGLRRLFKLFVTVVSKAIDKAK